MSRVALVMISSMVLSACSSPGGASAVECAAGDVDCFLNHLEVSENGAPVTLTTVDAGDLAGSSSPIVFLATDSPPSLYGSDGTSWRNLDPAGGAFTVSTSMNGETWALMPDLRRWNAAQGVFEPVNCPPSATGLSVFALPGAVLVGAVAGGHPTVYRYDADAGCTGGVIDGQLTGTIIALWSDGTETWAVDGNGTWRFTHGAWSRFFPGDVAPHCCWVGVWASSANDLWLYGPTTRHWNGSAFSADQTIASQVEAMSGSGPNDLWAGTPTEYWRSDGGVWAFASSSTESAIALWSGGVNDVWAVTRDFVPRHWNGSTWTDVPIAWPQKPNSHARLSGIPGSMHVTPPTVSTTNSAITVSAGASAALDLEWTDPYGARPAFCFMTCSKTARCSTRARCTPWLHDSLTSGLNHYRIGSSAVAAGSGEDVTVRVTPLSRANGADPLQDLRAAIHGPPKDIIEHLDGKTTGGSGGGGGHTSGMCSACVSGQACSSCPSGSIACGDKCCFSNSCSGTCWAEPSCTHQGCGANGPITVQACGITAKYTVACAGTNGGCCPSCMSCNTDGTCSLP